MNLKNSLNVQVLRQTCAVLCFDFMDLFIIQTGKRVVNKGKVLLNWMKK